LAKWLTLVLLLALAPLGALAEETPSPAGAPSQDEALEEAPADLGEIEVTAGPLELAVRSLPGQPVIVVKRNEWQPGARTVADVLEQLAPIGVQRTGGEGSLTTLSLRAAGAADTLVLLNGAPVAFPGGLPPDVGLFGLDQVERIEVLPGGSGAVHGSRAIGGVVNIVTRGGEGGTSFSLSAGSFGTVRTSYAQATEGACSNEILTASLFSTTGDFSFESVNGEVRARRNNEARRLLFTVGINSFRPARSSGWSREWSLSGSQGFVRYRDDRPTMGGPQRSRATDASLHSSVVLARELPRSTTEVAMQLSANCLSGSGYGTHHRLSGGLSVMHSFRRPHRSACISLEASPCRQAGTWRRPSA